MDSWDELGEIKAKLSKQQFGDTEAYGVFGDSPDDPHRKIRLDHNDGRTAEAAYSELSTAIDSAESESSLWSELEAMGIVSKTM
jgi:hypothetical protein